MDRYVFILNFVQSLNKPQGQWAERLSVTFATSHRILCGEGILVPWGSLLETPRVSVYSTVLNSLEPLWLLVTVKTGSNTIKNKGKTLQHRSRTQVGEQLAWWHNRQRKPRAGHFLGDVEVWYPASTVGMKQEFWAPQKNTLPGLWEKLSFISFPSALLSSSVLTSLIISEPRCLPLRSE